MIIQNNLNNKKYVWYASFGSNLNRDRFLCYIKGGRPAGSDKAEAGCEDPSMPVKEAKHVMGYPLYFAKKSHRWQQQGVAFIELNDNEECKTYSAKYLITEDQFRDVVRQENNDEDIHIYFNDIIKEGVKTLNDSWYGTIVYLGEEDGCPIFTFTSQDSHVPVNKPSDEYLSVIIEGLQTTINLTDREIMDYLLNTPGIKGYYNRRDIAALL